MCIHMYVCRCVHRYLYLYVHRYLSISFPPSLSSPLSFLCLPTLLPSQTDLNLSPETNQRHVFFLDPNEVQSRALGWWPSFPLTVARENSSCTCVTLTSGDEAALMRHHLPIWSCFSLRLGGFFSCSHSNRRLFSF